MKKRLISTTLVFMMLLSLTTLLGACSKKNESIFNNGNIWGSMITAPTGTVGNILLPEDSWEDVTPTPEETQPEDSYTANNNEICIGLSAPLSGSAAIYGVAVVNSAQMAIDEINLAGGLNGIRFRLIYADDQHDPSKVRDCYEGLWHQGMQISLGTVTTSPGMEWKELAKEDNVFFLTPSASGDKIPEYDNGYQMCVADGNQGKAAAAYINSRCAGQTIGIFYKSDEDYSQGIYAQFMDYLSPSVDVIEAPFTDAGATDFAKQVDMLKNCEFIFMPVYYQSAALFMLQARDTLRPDATFFGCDGFDGINSMESFDIGRIPQQVEMLAYFNPQATDGPTKAYVDKYIAQYGNGTLNQFGASAYDCVYAIYGALNKAAEEGKEISVTMSPSDLCEILKAQFNSDYTMNNGVTGTEISWDKSGYVNKPTIPLIIKEADDQEQRIRKYTVVVMNSNGYPVQRAVVEFISVDTEGTTATPVATGEDGRATLITMRQIQQGRISLIPPGYTLGPSLSQWVFNEDMTEVVIVLQ